MSNQLAWGVFVGAIAMSVVDLALQDWKAEAKVNEERGCVDKGDARAYMARLPGEAHTVEACVQFKRFGDPSWVPQLGDPLLVSGGVKGKPGKEQQLVWVRDECRKLAKQLGQRC